jgi:hypothetical protein
VTHIRRELGEAVITHGLNADPTMLRGFLAIPGAAVDEGPLPDNVACGVVARASLLYLQSSVAQT